MQELVRLINKYAQVIGVQETAIPKLHFSKRIELAGPLYGIQKLAFCIVVQGRKK